MYTHYFGFREKPFSITPDPRFFYTNPSYQAACANLLYGIFERRGFIVLTGEIGTGKTTLLRRLMEDFGDRIRFVYLYDSNLTFEEILDYICEELGVHVQDMGRIRKIQKLNQFLVGQLENGRNVVLLIDEAQNFSDEALENIRLLSNLETSSEKLLQIVIVGQPELEVKFNRTELRQLKQRIVVRCHLERLRNDEVGPYIYYRLSVVGYKRQQLFTPNAIKEIADFSKGFPRLINILCDNALLIAYATSQKRITTDIVREAAGDLRLEGPGGDPLITDEAGAGETSGGLKVSKRLGATSSDRAPYPRQPSGGRHWGFRIVIAILLLGIGGMGFYGWRINGSFFEEAGERLGTSSHALHGAIRGWIGNPGPNESPLASQQQARGNSQLTPFAEKNDPASAPDLPTMESPPGSRERHLPSQSAKMTGASETFDTAGRGNDQGGAGVSIPEMAGWREKSIVVQLGSTVAEIAANIYGAQRNLGLDLIKEYNTHIENLNRIIAGQRLWLPPLSRETLVRQQADGSYSLILTSFRTPQQSAQLANAVRQSGYDTVVTPRRVSDDILLYRVEISGLRDAEAVNQACEIALANQWIVFTDHGLGKLVIE